MNKQTKIILIISTIVFLLLGTLTLVVFFFKAQEPEQIEYPGSGLSGSIFDVQNTEYKPINEFSGRYKYNNISYILDVPDLKAATIGDGSVWRLSNEFYVFTTELPFNVANEEEVLGPQLGKVIMLDCNDAMTVWEQSIKEESGYRNGFGALYKIKKVSFSNGEAGTAPVTAIVMYYLVELPKESEDVIIGTLCLNETNKNIRIMKDYTDAMFSTFRFDEDYDKERLQQIHQDELSAERAEQQEELAEINAERQKALEEAEEKKKEQEAVITSEVPVEISQMYDRLRVDVSWKTYNSVQTLELVSPDGVAFPATVVAERSGYIEVNNAISGSWTLRVTGVDVGEVDITLTETSESSTESRPEDITEETEDTETVLMTNSEEEETTTVTEE